MSIEGRLSILRKNRRRRRLRSGTTAVASAAVDPGLEAAEGAAAGVAVDEGDEDRGAHPEGERDDQHEDGHEEVDDQHVEGVDHGLVQQHVARLVQRHRHAHHRRFREGGNRKRRSRRSRRSAADDAWAMLIFAR